ncbi:unnamed protein product [Meganyctiphanes norvegica]|uniref:RRM domain-containing protein n=1 Tax=Meganyctiphanes norvegica TaxID=48144 RepID=A0AAV2QCN5_MEGNR
MAPFHQQDTKCKLFVGGLSKDTTQDALSQYFAAYGEPQANLVMNKDTGQSKGFAFLNFSTADLIDQVQASRPHKIDGRALTTTRVLPKDDQGLADNTQVKKLFVARIRGPIEDSHIKEVFKDYGNILSVAIPIDKETQRQKGFVFVEFDDCDSVDKAICFRDEIQVNGNPVDIKKGIDKSQQAERGGRGRGGRGGGGGGMRGRGGGFQNSFSGGGYGAPSGRGGGGRGGASRGRGGYNGYEAAAGNGYETGYEAATGYEAEAGYGYEAAAGNGYDAHASAAIGGYGYDASAAAGGYGYEASAADSGYSAGYDTGAAAAGNGYSAGYAPRGAPRGGRGGFRGGRGGAGGGRGGPSRGRGAMGASRGWGAQRSQPYSAGY